ncbi:putative gustatory receptor 57a [Drosophila obscura]|uniref:putative gustatory receptor 57a n=1 Tax=Drosophila obscura TaxID=7282 RepID=UPI000B9FD210|nr:putative gustatory receptor 57a [Drosophila obscura]
MAVLYFFREPETLYDCASVICGIQFVMCCNGFRGGGSSFAITRGRRIYSLGVAGLTVLVLIGSLSALLGSEEIRKRMAAADKMVLSIAALEVVMSTLVFVGTVVSLQAAGRRHLGIYVRLSAMDAMLMRDFGANLNYRKLLRKNILVVVSCTVLYLGAITSAVVQMATGQRTLFLLSAFCYVFVTCGPHFTGYVYMSLVELLSIRFRLLQKILSPKFLEWRFPQRQLREQRIRQAVAMVQELHQLVLEINRVYAIGLWMSMAHDLAIGTSELYIIFGMGMASMEEGLEDEEMEQQNGSRVLLGYVALCMAVPLYKLLIAPFYCERTILEARRCLRLIEQLDNWYPSSPAIRQLVNSLMSWCLQFRQQFTIGLGIPLNRTVLTLFVAILVNYLLILIQFAMTQKMGEQIELQKVALQDWIGI